MDAAGVPGARVVTGADTGRDARDILDAVVDPEIPVLTIADLGILRDVAVVGTAVEVTITPTYSGCPAMEHIRGRVENVLHDAGFEEVTVRTVYSPAWSTDWITPAARSKLADYGIAPPHPTAATPRPRVLCPQCAGAGNLVSEFGSTACKALMVCSECGEPFDYFKEL